MKPLNLLSNVTVYENQTEITLDNRKILLLPWITNLNTFSNEFEESTKKYDLIFGHLSVISFNMGGSISSIGLDPKLLLSKATKTYLGHFHCRSKKIISNKSIQYVRRSLSIN